VEGSTTLANKVCVSYQEIIKDKVNKKKEDWIKV
jgi:hypothetical protein